MKDKKVAAQDYVEIMNLYNYYNLCSDAADVEGYASCFAEDGEHHLISFGLVIKGRDALRTFKRENPFNLGSGTYRRHWNGSLHLEWASPTEVRGRCYLLAYNGKNGEPPQISDCGYYEDTLVKVDGAWRYAKRRLTMDGSVSKARK
jgi:hypothetical protein